jgi:hypothetical protein
MDVNQIRHRNLLHLLNQVLPGRGVTKHKDAGQALGGIGASYLSQLKAGKKMGDDTARKIESGLGFDRGAMDRPLWDEGKVAEPSPHYMPDPPSIALTRRELALIDNYRAASEAVRRVLDAAALAGRAT